MDKCWAFYRRSTDRQELSIPDQRRECQALAKKMDLQIIREFEPLKGWGSGLTIDQDPSFQEMVRLAELGGHGVRYLLVYDVSRFGRLQPEDKIYWERRLKKQGGIQIVYAKDDFKNDGSTLDTLSKVLKHGEAHQFSMKLSELTLRGAKSHAALGHSTGGNAPFGYDRLLVDQDGKPVKVLRRGEWKADKRQRIVWIPSPTEKPIVQKVFDTYDKGMGLYMISQDLNDQGIRAPRGRFWSKVQIHYMLKNRVYLGERIYNQRSYKGYRRGDKGSLFNSKDQWVIKTDAHEAIIDRELFDRIQARRKSKPFGRGRPYHKPYLLSGLAVCARCGYKMMGWPKKGNGHTYLTYTCSGYQRIGRSACRSVNISGPELEGLAVRAIREHVTDSAWQKDFRRIIESMIRDQSGPKANRRGRELRTRLESIHRQIANVVEAVKDGRFSSVLGEELQKLENQRDEVRRELAEFDATAKAALSHDEIVDGIMETAANFDKTWEAAETVETRKEILRGFLKGIRIDHGDQQPKAHFQLYMIPQNRLAGHPLGTPGHAYNLSLLRG